MTLDEVWGLWSDTLQEALDRGHDPTPLASILEMVKEGHAQFWTWPTAVMVTTGRDDLLSGRRVCHIWLAGGSLDGLEQHLPEVATFARESGANAMTVCGRFGWMRSFLTKTAGFVPVAVEYHKELT